MENALTILSNQFQFSAEQRNDMLSFLQDKVDNSEKYGAIPFHDFNDLEMIWWFIYRKRNIDSTKNRSASTVKRYKYVLIQFAEHLVNNGHEFDLDIVIDSNAPSIWKALDKRHMRKYQEWLVTRSPHVQKKGRYSAATIDNKITIIKSFLKELHQLGYIHKPIHEGFLQTSVHKDERPNRDAGPSDVMVLLEGFDEIGHIPMLTLIQVLTTTGLRNEELCNLQVKDVHIDTVLGGHYLSVLGKGNKRRNIPLREKTLQAIHRFRLARELPTIQEASSDAPLFTNRYGKAFSPSYFSQYFKKQMEFLPLKYTQRLAKLNFTPHIFRHAFAIISHTQKVDVYDIMRSLGHERIDTTMIYLQKVFEKEHHAIQQWTPGTLGKYF